MATKVLRGMTTRLPIYSDEGGYDPSCYENEGDYSAAIGVYGGWMLKEHDNCADYEYFYVPPNSGPGLNGWDITLDGWLTVPPEAEYAPYGPGGVNYYYADPEDLGHSARLRIFEFNVSCMVATIAVDSSQVNSDGTRTIKFTAVPLGGTAPYRYDWQINGTYRSKTGLNLETCEVVMQQGDSITVDLDLEDGDSPPCTDTASGIATLDSNYDGNNCPTCAKSMVSARA